jgi:hypothetical protein
MNFSGGRNNLKELDSMGAIDKVTALFFPSFVFYKICFVSHLFRSITVAHFVFLVAHCLPLFVVISLFSLFRVVCSFNVYHVVLS